LQSQDFTDTDFFPLDKYTQQNTFNKSLSQLHCFFFLISEFALFNIAKLRNSLYSLR